jgi:hypothetical protein
MKATLEFNLDDPDDRMAHLRCVKALDMALALFEINYNLRKKVERDDIDVWEAIVDIFDEQGINPDELIR